MAQADDSPSEGGVATPPLVAMKEQPDHRPGDECGQHHRPAGLPVEWLRRWMHGWRATSLGWHASSTLDARDLIQVDCRPRAAQAAANSTSMTASTTANGLNMNGTPSVNQ